MNETTNRPRWDFFRKAPADPQIEPFQDVLFSGDAVNGPAGALVREIIQNSLDARVGDGPVTVRFTLLAEPVPGGMSSAWTGGLLPHLQAEGNGLRSRPQAEAALSAILVEDFGTCGLQGDVFQTNDTASDFRGRRNHFFHFWRAVGSSGKDAGERGSWGLGKTVLPASSEINAFFGLSVLEDGTRHLMGMSVLRHHHAAGDGPRVEPFKPYGWFGMPATSTAPTLPITDGLTIDRFRADFRVGRTNESGLSLVILMPRSCFARGPLVAAVIVQYFYPILEGALTVEVLSGNQMIVIDASSIADQAADHEPFLSEQRITLAALKDTLRLARWSIEQRRSTAVTLSANPNGARWEPSVFAVPEWPSLADRFAKGQPIELVVPVTLHTKPDGELKGEFCVTLQRAPDDQPSRVFFLRDGITISDIKESKSIARGLTAFVTADSGPLAAYLRLSEDPSHTRWEENSRLKQSYERHAMPLRFVKGSVKSVYTELTRPKQGIDVDLLADLFFIETDAEPTVKSGVPGGRGTRTQKPRIPLLPPPPDPLRVHARAESVVLSGNVENAKPSEVYEVRLAYDVRRGDPFSRWSPHDFQLEQLQIDWSGVMRIDASGCRLVFAVIDPAFEITISGLDESRDLRVRTTRFQENS